MRSETSSKSQWFSAAFLKWALDLVAVNRWEAVEIWRQEAALGSFVQVALHLPGANRDAIGAVLEVRRGDRVERREVTVGGGHAGGQLGWRHIGLADAQAVDVRVIWPGGVAGGAHRAGASPGVHRRPRRRRTRLRRSWRGAARR